LQKYFEKLRNTKLFQSIQKSYPHPKKIFQNSSAAEDVVTEEYFEKFFCYTKIIHSLQINIFGLKRIFTLREEHLRQ
jgi:hypothetical protein